MPEESLQPEQEPQKEDRKILAALRRLLRAKDEPKDEFADYVETPRVHKRGNVGLIGVVMVCVVLVMIGLVGSSMYSRMHMPTLISPEEAKRLSTPPMTADPDSLNGFKSSQKNRSDGMANEDALNVALGNAKKAQADAQQSQQNEDSDDISPAYKARLTPQQRDAQAGKPYRGGGSQSGGQLSDRQQREKDALDSSPLAVDYSSYFRDKTSKAAGKDKPAEAVDTHADRGPVAENSKPPLEQQDRQQQQVDPTEKAKLLRPDYDLGEGKDYRIFEDTVIEVVLMNRVNGSFVGPLKCMVTTNVYSLNHQTLLIPQGTVVLGDVRSVGSSLDERLFVAFHRMIMPDGWSESLDKFKGLNVIGETGLRDIVNHHYAQIFGTSLAIAGIGAVANVGNTVNALSYSFGSQLRTSAGQQLGQQANQILARYLNRLPTFTVREGERIKIYFANDLQLKAYASHKMDPEL